MGFRGARQPLAPSQTKTPSRAGPAGAEKGRQVGSPNCIVCGTPREASQAEGPAVRLGPAEGAPRKCREQCLRFPIPHAALRSSGKVLGDLGASEGAPCDLEPRNRRVGGRSPTRRIWGELPPHQGGSGPRPEASREECPGVAEQDPTPRPGALVSPWDNPPNASRCPTAMPAALRLALPFNSGQTSLGCAGGEPAALEFGSALNDLGSQPRRERAV